MNLEEATIKALEGKLLEKEIKVYSWNENSGEENLENIRSGIGYWFTTDEGYAYSKKFSIIQGTLNLKNTIDLNSTDGDELFYSLVKEYYGKIVSKTKFFGDKEFGEYLKNKGYDSISFDYLNAHYYTIIYIVLDSNCIDITRW